MAADAYPFRDEFGRPYHRQVFLSGGENARGAYIDTLEFGFQKPLTEEEQTRFRAVLESELGAEKLQRVAWPNEGRRAFICLTAGYYHLKPLEAAIVQAGFSPTHQGALYSARLGKAEAPVGSLSGKGASARAD